MTLIASDLQVDPVMVEFQIESPSTPVQKHWISIGTTLECLSQVAPYPFALYLVD